MEVPPLDPETKPQKELCNRHQSIQDIFTNGGAVVNSLPRWERCVAVSLNYFGAKVSQLFYRFVRNKVHAPNAKTC